MNENKTNINWSLGQKTVREGYQEWLSTPRKNGQLHNDNNIRKFSDKDDKYLNNWNDY